MAAIGNLSVRYRPVRRLGLLHAGLLLYGASMSLMIRANLGLDPWDVFHQGVSKLTGLSFGVAVIAISAVVLLFWIPLRQKPGIGTISNAIVIGLTVDAMNTVLPAPSLLWLRWVYGVGGVLATGVASGLYIGARLGPGPRDGLMTGVAIRWHGRWFAQIRVVRTAIEVLVLGVGFAMGGTIGPVTVLYALGIGPLAHVMIPIFAVRDPAPAPVTEAATVVTETEPALARAA
jgi:uncharacterized membrane protein YczE